MYKTPDALGNQTARAVGFTFPEATALGGGTDEVLSNVGVAMSDVTFLLDPASGFQKLSSWALVDGNREIIPVSATIVESETKEVFVKELEFLVSVFPQLRDDQDLVIIVDQDAGKIAAIHQVLGPSVNVFLCLWHKKKNFAKKEKAAGKELKTAAAAAAAAASGLEVPVQAVGALSVSELKAELKAGATRLQGVRHELNLQVTAPKASLQQRVAALRQYLEQPA